jgi:hypothetical protein
MGADRHNTAAGLCLNFNRNETPIMNSLRPQFYPHRRKLDGSLDSICLNCLATIATSSDETELEAREKEHVCSKIFPEERLMAGRLPF